MLIELTREMAIELEARFEKFRQLVTSELDEYDPACHDAILEGIAHELEQEPEYIEFGLDAQQLINYYFRVN